MRNFAGAVVILLVLTLAIFSVSFGQYFEPAVFVNLDEVEGLTAYGQIPDGGTITIPVRFKNIDESRWAVSNGYVFSSAFGEMSWTGLTGEWNPAYPWVCEVWPPPCTPIPYFDQGPYVTELVDTIGFAALRASYGTGLPADFDGIAYFITLTDITGPLWEVLTMDSSWWPPANMWIWSGVLENVYWGGPYEIRMEHDPVCTYASPQPTILRDMEQLIEFYICCDNPNEINWESIRIQGKIPPYEGYPILRDNCLVTACLTTRFIGSSGFRPIPPEGVQDHYTVEYDKLDGSHVILTGDYVLGNYQGDVNLDGEVNMDDVIFMSDYLFSDGRMCEIEEFMDIDANGTLDIKDMNALIDLVSE